MLPLSEDHLIGAIASILDFVLDADAKPCRLVVLGSSIKGLVTLSNLQKLPVRSALFALATGLEMTMSEAIRQRFRSDDEWMSLLSRGRRDKLYERIEKSKRENSFVDALLSTQSCDKAA